LRAPPHSTFATDQYITSVQSLVSCISAGSAGQTFRPPTGALHQRELGKMPQCAAVGLQTLSNSLASRKQHGHRVLATAPLLALPRQPGRQLRTGLTCSLRPQQQEAVVQQREAEERASEPLPSVQAPQQQQGQLEHAAAERWMPASWLSGWKGAGSLLLSFGAVTGGGLMGAWGAGDYAWALRMQPYHFAAAATGRPLLTCCMALLPVPPLHLQAPALTSAARPPRCRRWACWA
jgi:hypothetical protein